MNTVRVLVASTAAGPEAWRPFELPAVLGDPVHGGYLIAASAELIAARIRRDGGDPTRLVWEVLDLAELARRLAAPGLFRP